VNGRRLLLSPLWLIVALVTFVAGGASSAAAAGGPETRVSAIPTPAGTSVAANSSERPASVGCLRPAQPAMVVGSCVATKALPAGSPGRVVANALEPHELAQAQSVVGYRGGTFVGNSTRGAPGIDGMLDGVPASLKAYSGSSPSGVLRHVSQAEASASKAGYSGVQVYVDAPGVSRSTLLDFGANGPLSQIPTQGTVSTIYVQTADGWVVFPG
jgi:hypothetical protein